MDVQQERYLGFDCLHLSNGHISAWVTQKVGLRLVGLALPGRDNLMAHLPDARIEVAEGQDYVLRGGHRLWYGPEVPQVTYLPDNRPVDSHIGESYVEQEQPADEPTGIVKAWRIELAPGVPMLTIDHKLTNKGKQPITLAPWAITMLEPGGLGILPQQMEPSDPNSLQPNRHVVLWPYTPIQSEFIEWRDEAIFVQAAMQEGAIKIGAPNPRGWLAYKVDDQIFVKSTDFEPEAEYIDRGATSQVYCNPEVIELETLGPKVQLQPGETVEHSEIWELSLANECRQDVRALYQKYFEGSE